MPEVLEDLPKRAVWFHRLLLPGLWFGNMVLIHAAFLGVSGDRAMAQLGIGIAGWWLGWIGAAGSSVVGFILLNLIGGVLTMSLVGFFQDVLRVPRWVLFLYPAGAILLLLYRWGGETDGNLLRRLLMDLCLSTYAICTLSLLFTPGWRLVRWTVRASHKRRG